MKEEDLEIEYIDEEEDDDTTITTTTTIEKDGRVIRKIVRKRSKGCESEEEIYDEDEIEDEWQKGYEQGFWDYYFYWDW